MLGGALRLHLATLAVVGCLVQPAAPSISAACGASRLLRRAVDADGTVGCARRALTARSVTVCSALPVGFNASTLNLSPDMPGLFYNPHSGSGPAQPLTMGWRAPLGALPGGGYVSVRFRTSVTPPGLAGAFQPLGGPDPPLAGAFQPLEGVQTPPVAEHQI